MSRYEAPILTEVREAALDTGRAKKSLEEAQRRRDRLAREAYAAGIGPTEIAAAVGMTRGAVYKIIEKGQP